MGLIIFKYYIIQYYLLEMACIFIYLTQLIRIVCHYVMCQRRFRLTIKFIVYYPLSFPLGISLNYLMMNHLSLKTALDKIFSPTELNYQHCLLTIDCKRLPHVDF